MVAMLPNARMQLQPLFVSLVRRMMATLINCVVEKTSAHSGDIMSVALSPDGTKIVSACSGGMIIVWDSGAPRALKSPLLGQH
jgi:WD40 repeat protein